ncbi:hypothetical protein [Reyranella sp.]|uniref:hypothetical protein n=1 Tax=Reyranella sp. TaxID=1929291 RepID=UPI003D0C94DD
MTDPKKSFADMLPELPPVTSGGIDRPLHPKLIKALKAAVNAPTGAEPTKPIGAPRRDRDAWRIFVLIVQAKRHQRGAAGADSSPATTKSELYDAVCAGEGPTGATRGNKYTAAATERYAKSYRRSLAAGWRDSDVPDGIAAMFSTPPRART